MATKSIPFEPMKGNLEGYTATRDGRTAEVICAYKLDNMWFSVLKPATGGHLFLTEEMIESTRAGDAVIHAQYREWNGRNHTPTKAENEALIASAPKRWKCRRKDGREYVTKKEAMAEAVAFLETGDEGHDAYEVVNF